MPLTVGNLKERETYLAGDPFCDALCEFISFTATLEGFKTALGYNIGSEGRVSVVILSAAEGGIPWQLRLLLFAVYSDNARIDDFRVR
jgi:hypothetical protein